MIFVLNCVFNVLKAIYIFRGRVKENSAPDIRLGECIYWLLELPTWFISVMNFSAWFISKFDFKCCSSHIHSLHEYSGFKDFYNYLRLIEKFACTRH